MREIKFRAWDPKERKMYFSDHGDIGRHGYDVDEQCHEWGWAPAVITWCNPKNPPDDVPDTSNFSLMQYTGLKDKNGKEIYEGDVLRKEFGEGPKTWKVICDWHFLKSGFWVYGVFIDSEDEAGKTEAEVIGNVWENPELLKKNEDNH